jgi:hypothetical protein
VAGGQAVPTLGGIQGGVVHQQDAGHGLLLQPLAGVPFVDAGPRREL